MQEKVADAKQSELAQLRQRRTERFAALDDSRREAPQVDSNYDHLQRDPRFDADRRAIFADYEELPRADRSSEGLYLNPFAGYLQGLFYRYSDVPGERELARSVLRTTVEMAPRNGFAAAELDEVQKGGDGPPPSKTYVIFETGMAPTRAEIRIDLPIFLLRAFGGRPGIDYIGVAFPKLVRHWDRHPFLDVAAGGTTYRTEALADMDQIVAREFADELPLIITRLVISTGVKVAAQYAAERATNRSDPIVQILTRGGLVVYEALTNEADVRTWHTLPKQVQIASFPTPADGRVNLVFPGGFPAGTATVRPDRINIV